MANTYTRAQAQDKAVAALEASAAYDGQDLGRMERYATVALAWATLAQTLPIDLVPTADRPFGEATSR